MPITFANQIRVPAPVRAALVTAAWTFVATFATTTLGWLQDVGAWADSGGTESFPAWSILAYGAGSALVAAVAGLGNFIQRYAQERTGVGSTPVYVSTRKGEKT